MIAWEKDKLLSKYNVKYVVLYSPSSDESLSSAKVLKDAIVKLSSRKDLLFLIHFDEDVDEDIVKWAISSRLQQVATSLQYSGGIAAS